MRLWISPLLWLGLLLGNLPLHAEEETTADVHKRLSVTFTQADTNRDQKLSLAEFLAGRDNPAIAKRDFRMCDFNDDQDLSLDEFLTVPSVVAAKHRGPLPDLIADHAAQIMQTLDKTYNWDTEPNGVFNPNFMVVSLAQQLSEWGGGWVSNDASKIADPESDGLTRDNARRFIEVFMGMRNTDGTWVRRTNGQVVDLQRFQFADFDGDNQLDEREFARIPNPPAAELTAGDTDGNGMLSFPEWIAMDKRAILDPVEDFRRMDANLNAVLDRQEITQGIAKEYKPFAGFLFPAFDWDQNGVLSLREYRTLMLTSPVLPWHDVQLDNDGDGVLTFKEFAFEPHTHRWTLLRMLYFQRLDRNQDKKLDASEWILRKGDPDQFLVVNPDGTDWRPFYRFEGYRHCFAPAVSPDGRWIAFGAMKLAEKASLYIMPIDGGTPRLVTEGTGMGTWSPDSQKLVCAKTYEEPRAIWEVTIPQGEQVAVARKLVEGGLMACASPDGKLIAVTDIQTVDLYDCKTEETREIFSAVEGPYDLAAGIPFWSPNGEKLCFQVRTRQWKHQLLCCNGAEPRPAMTILQKFEWNAQYFAWHPTQSRILFTAYCPERQRIQIYDFDPLSQALPTLFPGQDSTRNNKSLCWTPDGKRLIVISGDF